MQWFEGLILGFLQGLTEFLPVSSSGHLIIGQELLGVESSSDAVFEVVVHAATVLSTLVVFRKQIWSLLKGFFKFKYNEETDYILKIAVSMIPIFIVGMFFKDEVKSLFSSIYVVGGALVATAVLLTFSDLASKWTKPKENKERQNGISYLQAFIVGLGQAVAVIPGLSRSGTTIATGLISGVKRNVIAQFSFLMVLIPILGETFLGLVSGEIASSSVGVLPLICGFVSAFISGLLACKLMIALVKKSRLIWFAVYCMVVAALIFIFA